MSALDPCKNRYEQKNEIEQLLVLQGTRDEQRIGIVRSVEDALVGTGNDVIRGSERRVSATLSACLGLVPQLL